jgi:hypothetical protein
MATNPISAMVGSVRNPNSLTQQQRAGRGGVAGTAERRVAFDGDVPDRDPAPMSAIGRAVRQTSRSRRQAATPSTTTSGYIAMRWYQHRVQGR